MTGNTNTGNRIKLLRKEAADHQRALNAAHRLARCGVPAAGIIEEQMQERDRALAEASRLKDSGQARLEDIQVYQVERVTTSKKSGSTKTHKYYYASWRRPDGAVFNKYLGSCKRLDHVSALEKAKKLKAMDLGIDLE
jgi:hypothetical protein